MRPIYLGLFLLFFGAYEDAAGAGASTVTRQDRELVDLQLQGMKDNLDRLVSGVFRASGRKQVRNSPDSPPIFGAVEYFCAFDYPSNLFRFDRKVPMIRGGLLGGDKPAVDYQEGIYARTAERSFYWTHEQGDLVVRQQPDAKPPRPAISFDVRCVGLAFDLDVGVSRREQYRSLSEAKVVEVSTEAKGICRILWELDEAHTFVTAWFDQEHGYMPIRVEVRGGDLVNLPTAPLQRAETTWKNISDVWVPSTFVSEYFNLDGELKSKTELAFNWESVNQSVPEKFFSPEGFDLPPETRIASDELGERVFLGTIGSQQSRAEHYSKKSSTNMLAATIFTVLMVILLVTVAALRIRRRRA